jgi:DNA-binding transcriptional ArsR family regulator
MGEVSELAAAPRPTGWLEVIADPVRLSIMRALSEVGEATTADLAVSSQASNQTLRRHLEALVAQRVIEEHPPRSDGETPGRPATRYSLPLEMRASVRAVLGGPAATPRRPGRLNQPVATSPPRTLAVTSLAAARGPMNGARAR